MSNLLELPFGTPPGKVQLPSQSPKAATNNHQLMPILHCCTKPSRWWQPPRVTSEIHSATRTPSASRCNHSSNALGFSPNLTMMMNQSQDEYIANHQENHKEERQSIFSRGSRACQHATSPLCRPTLGGSAAKRCFTNLTHTIGHRKNRPTSELTQ